MLLFPLATETGAALTVTTGAGELTETVTDCVALPPLPVQVSSYSVEFVRVPVGQVPLVATLPCQPPAAVQALAPTEFQVSVELPPLLTVVGAAVRVTVARVTDALVGEATTTSTDCMAVPPGPVHASVKLVAAVSGGVVIVPVVGTAPLQPPEAVQVWALEAFHCSVTVAPMATLLALACRLTIGAVGGVAAAAALIAPVVPVKAFDED